MQLPAFSAILVLIFSSDNYRAFPSFPASFLSGLCLQKNGGLEIEVVELSMRREALLNCRLQSMDVTTLQTASSCYWNPRC
ncbi:hypothetical protein BU26DRAFT_257478 [Trematosphaeria pertusa]|uniref:Uncharacterized protein n=1 Tax=Trematosphaeria pertusa TaxID=390896 RepID=A0A6A6IPT4_9PLEO|nr:uncharacterized protein BU26DRAFT_257478 [Trematosphaeria pertusa]KAF2252471.1 hypothetical protein BU26DRAFT_257478 [Trematosphaeria pertusa]